MKGNTRFCSKIKNDSLTVIVFVLLVLQFTSLPTESVTPSEGVRSSKVKNYPFFSFMPFSVVKEADDRSGSGQDSNNPALRERMGGGKVEGHW